VQLRGGLTSSFSCKANIRLSVVIPLVCLVVAALGSWGCKSESHNHLSPTQVHGISREMMRAAAGFPGEISYHLQFDGAHSDRSDQLLIMLPAQVSEKSRRESLANLIQSIDGVATANNLTRDNRSSTGTLIILNFHDGRMTTHSIHIVAPTPVRTSAPAKPDKTTGTARLAIILDDLGGDRAAADAIFALPYPLTISVLPNHAHSTEIAEEAHRLGYEVMLHLPMQSVADETPEAQELRPGMPANEIPVLFEQLMESVPYATGVNNHQGSQATADATLMEELMPILQKWNLFYVDSRTTAATVAYDTAQHVGVRSGFRNVPFLDDVAEVSAVRKQLELAFRGARDKGEAIAIGHPHPATLQALREILPQAEAQGIHLVHASDVVH